jgi:dolichol-phosphate mannosyltransferase
VKLAIAIPTYNEVDNLKKLIPAIHKKLRDYPGLSTTLFIVDDNSPDGTAKIATALGKKHATRNFKLTVLNREKKEGLGKAYIYAIEKILDLNTFDFILQMDADLSHNPTYIPSFIKATATADFVVGSRYIKGGSTPDWSWTRKLLSRFGNIYTKMLLGDRIHDYTGGFNMYSRALLESLDVATLQTSGYGFLIELKYRAINQANGIIEVPIIFMDRLHGTSKIPRSTIVKNLLLVLKLAVADPEPKRITI